MNLIHFSYFLNLLLVVTVLNSKLPALLHWYFIPEFTLMSKRYVVKILDFTVTLGPHILQIYA